MSVLPRRSELSPITIIEGVEARIGQHEKINRTCIYIRGEANKGKTYAAEHALLDMGLNLFRVKGGGTGKFDDLSAAHDAILIDDDVCPNLLNMTDDYICRAYKRGRNNPPWTGTMFVVTSNMPFYDWLDLCGMHIQKRDRDGDLRTGYDRQPVLTEKGKNHGPAMSSRFVLMHIETADDGISRLELDAGQSRLRGSPEERQAKVAIAADFRDRFNAIISKYRPQDDLTDWRALCADENGEYKLYQCRYCRHIDIFLPGTATCSHCGKPISSDEGRVMTEQEFLDLASADAEARDQALIEFARGFWTSAKGGMIWHMKTYPDMWDDPEMESKFANHDAMLADAIKHSRPQDVSYLQQRFHMSEIVDAVQRAWRGAYGDIPPLQKRSCYLRLMRNSGETQGDQKFKVCPHCWQAVPAGMKFCGTCGAPMPDQVFTGDSDITIATLRLAAERGCAAEDVPVKDAVKWAAHSRRRD